MTSRNEWRLRGQLALRREHAAAGITPDTSPADMLAAAVNFTLSVARLAYRAGIPADEAITAAAAEIMAAAERIAALIERHISDLAEQRQMQITEQQRKKVIPA